MKRIMHYFRIINNMKLRTKLLLSNFFLLTISLGLLFMYSSDRISYNTENHVLFSVKQGFDQTYSFLSYMLTKVGKTSSIITTGRKTVSDSDKTIPEVLSRGLNNYDTYQQIEDMYFFQRYLPSFEDDMDIFRLRLYVQDGLLYSNENENIFSLNEITDSIWYNKLLKSDNNIVWCPPSYFGESETGGLRFISAAKLIKNINNYRENAGILMVDIEEKTVRNIISRANTIKNTTTYIQNQEGVIVTASDTVPAHKILLDDSCFLETVKAYTNWNQVNVNGEKVLINSRLIENTDWYMTTIVPFGEILSESQNLRNEMLIVVLIIAFLAFLLAYFISYSITKRLSHLTKRIRDVQKGNFNIISNLSGSDEVGELIENYNFMIEKIKMLIHEQYKSGQEVKNAELKALQAQINPHFLYNTLDLIKWMSLKNMGKEVGKIVDVLAGFYKLSLNKGKDLISIADELRHVSYYVLIQNIRYENKISLEIKVDEQIKRFIILKIIMQPIVENSIFHGILRKPVKEGVITIRGESDNGDVMIYITDDGVGLGPEQLAEIQTGTIQSKSGSGYGIKNINERIKLYYGERYGLTYESQPGIGTTVIIRLPAVSENTF